HTRFSRDWSSDVCSSDLEYIPIISGSEINDDPLAPISRYGRDIIDRLGDDTPIEWIHREERFFEKLATPDVTVADLIGDVDPIRSEERRVGKECRSRCSP